MLRVLISHPDPERRELIEECLTATGEVKEIATASEVREALRVCRFREFDAIVLASVYDPDALLECLDVAYKSYQCANTAFILHVPQNSDSASLIADAMLAGIHAFLIDPLTPARVMDSIRIGRHVKAQGSLPRLRAAVGLKFAEIMKQDDAVSLQARAERTRDEFRVRTGQSLTLAVIKNLQNLPPKERVLKHHGILERLGKIISK